MRNRPAVPPLLVLAVLALAVLAGCGDKEPARREAFIALLQTKILAPRGAAVPALSDADKKALGDYAEHYALLARFHKKMADEVSERTAALLALDRLEDLDALAGRRKSLEKAASEARALQESIAGLRRDADKSRAGLRQPPDLAKVYAAAYDKTVRIPARTSEAAFRAVADTFAAIMDLLDFVAANARDLEISGQTIKVRNPALQPGLDARMNEVRRQSGILMRTHEEQAKVMLP